MKVVFAIDLAGQSSELGLMLKLAIQSCQLNTRHQPLVISNNFSPSFQQWFEDRNVEFSLVDAPMANAVRKANVRSGYPLQAIGNYLRYEACRIIDDEFFLYCDCDTVFLRDFDISLKPRFLAAVAEDTPEDWSRFNSGVMLFNREAMLDELDNFYKFAEKNLEELFPGFDQAAINVYFSGRIDRLPIELNWRPYWGANDRAAILHTHGVKPHVAESLLNGFYVADQNKKDLIVGIVCRSLTHLDAFVAPLSKKFPQLMSDTILDRWATVSEKAARLIGSPVQNYVEYAQDIRENDVELWEKAEQSILDTMLNKAEVTEYAFRCDGVTAVRFVISSPTMYHVISNLIDETSSVELPIESCTVSNLREVKSLTIRDRSFRVLKKVRADRPLDLVYHFHSQREGAQAFRIAIVHTSTMHIKRYWSFQGPFSEDNAEKVLVI